MSTAQERSRKQDIRVGIFVALGIVVLVATIFVIGQERHLFESPAFLKARFPNVAGLKVGAPVHLAGVPVGIVSKIEFPVLDKSLDVAVMDQVDASTLVEDAELDLKVKTFDVPTNISLTARDMDTRLKAKVRIEGTDALGGRMSETLTVRLDGAIGISVGEVDFKSIDRAILLEVSNATSGDTLQLGLGRSRKILVEMRLASEVLDRIRLDSVAIVDSIGLLGDKTIDVTLGSAQFPPHKDGDFIQAGKGALDDALSRSAAIFANIDDATEEIAALLEGFTSAGGDKALIDAVSVVRDLANEVKDGEGLVHQLIYDEDTGQETKRIVREVRRTTAKLNSTIGQVDKVIAEVRTGKSLAHELLYGEDGSATLDEARGVLAEATQILKDVQEKEGLAHQLIYTEDDGKTIANVNDAINNVKKATGEFEALATDARGIVADVKAGRGTIGGLIVDPTVYEDLKVLLGDVKRNEALKSLVRFSLAEEDAAVKKK